MKIVHVNHSDNIGGAAIAAYRLSTAMSRAGIDSKLLVYRNLRIGDPMVEGLLPSKVSLVFHQIRIRLMKALVNLLFKPFGTYSIPLSGMKIHHHHLVKDADVIILHWVSSGMMSSRELKAMLSMNKPVFWMLHDEYPFTGGCHCNLDCEGFKTDCLCCPFVKRNRFLEVSYHQLLTKKEIYKNSNLHFIGPSKWIVDSAKESAALTDKEIAVCRNVIDTDLFTKSPVGNKKQELGLDPIKKTILFSAASVRDRYKGWRYLVEALKNLPHDRYQCIVLGQEAEENDCGLEMFYLGYVQEEARLSEIYNLADVFVLPSLCESFSLVVAEAMACGVPCVGFDCTAIPGLITHKKTGYLADYLSVDDLSNGIRWVCEQSDYDVLSKRCVEFIESNCSFHRVSDIYSVVLNMDKNKK